MYKEKQGIIGDVKLCNILLRGHAFNTKAPSRQTLLFLSMLLWWITAVPPLACKEALRGALAAGRPQKEVELTTTSLEFEFRPQFFCGSPSTKLCDFRQSAWSGNERECKQTDAINN